MAYGSLELCDGFVNPSPQVQGPTLSSSSSGVSVLPRAVTAGLVVRAHRLQINSTSMNLTARGHDESTFRTIERELDRRVGAAMPRLTASNVDAYDESAREYHYKNELLVWAYRFETSWRAVTERAQITVRLQFAESDRPPESSKVELRTVAEAFQIGQISRVRKEEWRVVPFERLSADGIEVVVLGEVTSAQKLLQASGVAAPAG